MYPTISHLLHDLFGIPFFPLPIQTFGFFVAMAFLVAGFFLSKELMRYEAMGVIKATKIKVLKNKAINSSDFMWALATGFILGYKIFPIFTDYYAFTDDPQTAILSTQGSFLGAIIGMVILGGYKYYEKQKLAGKKEYTADELLRPHHLSGNILMIAAISGILGAKLFHNLENIDQLIANPIEALFSFSGLTFYGGLIAGIVSVSYYVKKHGIGLITIADITAPPVMLAYGVGRIGCQMSGDGDWGINNLNPKPDWMASLPDWMWSYTYPNNVIGAGVPIDGCVGKYCNELANPVYPTPFYEAILGVLLFLFLWNLRKKIRVPGMLFSIYLIVNGLERFFIEKIRINNKLFGMDITQAELIAAGLVLMGIIGVFYFKKRHQNAHPTV